MIALPEDAIELARQRARWFACEWFLETPIKIHGDGIDAGGAPELHHEFVAYLDEALAQRRGRMSHEGSPKLRVKRAFRTLRQKAPREFDAAYCMIVIDEVGRDVRRGDDEALRREFDSSLRATTMRLNQRAAKRRLAGHDERDYSEDEVLVLVVSALHKLSLWAG